jgi:hypothetical protein
MDCFIIGWPSMWIFLSFQPMCDSLSYHLYRCATRSHRPRHLLLARQMYHNVPFHRRTSANTIILTVYFNGLLGMLNARDTLREKNSGQIIEIMPDRSPMPSNASHDYPPIVARSFTFGMTHENYNVGLQQLCFNIMLSAPSAG